MLRKMIAELRPQSPKNKLHVEVYEVLNEEKTPIGVGYSVVSTADDNKWWINIHPAEIDELIALLQKAKEISARHKVGELLPPPETPQPEKPQS